MGDLILAGVLTWLMVFVWWGTNLLLGTGRQGKMVGGFLIALGLVPVLIALWLGTQGSAVEVWAEIGAWGEVARGTPTAVVPQPGGETIATP